MVLCINSVIVIHCYYWLLYRCFKFDLFTMEIWFRHLAIISVFLDDASTGTSSMGTSVTSSGSMDRMLRFLSRTMWRNMSFFIFQLQMRAGLR